MSKISTVNGDFGANSSPFMMRPWAQGYSGIGVDQSRSGKTLMIDTMPQANVQTENIQFQTVLNVGTHLSIVDGVVTYIGDDPPPPTPTTPPPTTIGPTTTAPTTVMPTTTAPTTSPPPTTPPPTTPTPPTTAPPTTPPP